MSNSQRLSEINAILQTNSTDSQQQLIQVEKELRASREELRLLKAELGKLKSDLQTAKNLSQSQADLLTKINESFKAYSKEQKAIQSKLKLERNASILIAILVGVLK